MHGTTRTTPCASSTRSTGGAGTRRHSGRPIPYHSELGDFIEAEMRHCRRFDVQEHPSGLRVLDERTGAFMDTDQIRAYRSQLELERGEWAPVRCDVENVYRTHNVRMRAQTPDDGARTGRVLGEAVHRKLDLASRQFMARMELDGLVSNQMYALEKACLEAAHLEAFGNVDLLKMLPPELWVRLLDIETHHLNELTSSRLELVRFDAPRLADLEPGFGFIHPIQVVVRSGDADVEVIPFDGLFDDSRHQACVSAWVISSLGIRPTRIAGLVSQVMPGQANLRAMEEGLREMVDAVPAKHTSVDSTEDERDYECDCTCYGSTCSNEFDEDCLFPWLRKGR